jgi:asparagine synthetase B (glutamine-hydrolysing)
MCGIAGWVSFDRDLRSEQATVDAMTETRGRRFRTDSDTEVVLHGYLEWGKAARPRTSSPTNSEALRTPRTCTTSWRSAGPNIRTSR